MPHHLLLIEDDESLHRGIAFTLQQEGFEVTGAHHLEEAERALAARSFDLIVLDVQLPDGSGFDFCAKLRQTSDTPVVFLTASDTEIDIVRGLDIGGDDYITKPFRLREFLSRIHAVLRRRAAMRAPDEESVWRSGDLTLHPGEMRLQKQGRDIALSITEFRLLSLFMSHPRAVLSKEQILQHLWQNGGDYIDDNTVAVNIRRLREKIEERPEDPQRIVTVRGAGYRWNA
ncbi:response regulator transcription factor [Cohnella nanjingensis]|uniref:Response regulator transcription factor n=1 Tax=Cohnella nanjingensis TaxID=1387779 RepID=A0A7X0RMP8_9BACL|nr:response regulator transcription factor [Cohnella nanjingensis]MBB6670307.1 response regulator transcription factor [Cohnella nanjingensis]